MKGALLPLALLLGCFLPGCTLIDQNTFRPGAGNPPVVPPAPPAPVAAPALPGPPPLVILQPDQAEGAALRDAVAAARARKRDVAFDVMAILPGTPTEEVARQGAGGAARVARAITAAGVPASRIRVLARPEPAATVGDVRVFVH